MSSIRFLTSNKFFSCDYCVNLPKFMRELRVKVSTSTLFPRTVIKATTMYTKDMSNTTGVSGYLILKKSMAIIKLKFKKKFINFISSNKRNFLQQIILFSNKVIRFNKVIFIIRVTPKNPAIFSA